MAREISSKGPYARKFGNTVREIETLLDVIGQKTGHATDTPSFRLLMKDLWVWVKDWTLLENEVVELREQVADLKKRIVADTVEMAKMKPVSPQDTGSVKITAADEGVWFDGSRGTFLPAAVIYSAWQNGFKCEELDELWKKHEAGTLVIELAHPGGEFWEMIALDENYYEIFQDAENWFNEHAPEGYYFGTPEWGDDWGLWKIESEEGAEEAEAEG
jgi:hypothetical protein